MAANKGKWLAEILQEYSTQKYFIEYQGFKSNHMAHGIVALNELGASQTKIGEFAKWCTKLLEPPEHPDHTGEDPDTPPVSDQTLPDLLGKRKSYYGIRNNYISKLNTCGSLEDVIKAEFPKLSRGLGCVAMHGLIQLGYGFHAGHGTVVSEGLAYMHHSYQPIIFDETKAESDIENFGKGDTDVLDILSEMKADSSLRQHMLDGALVNKKLGKYLGDGFSNRFVFLTNNSGDILLQYANRINIPFTRDGITETEFLINLSDWLTDQAIAVYAMSERQNDFFLLHGVTSAWSLRQIIPYLCPKDAMDAMRTFACDLMAVYLTVDAPALTKAITTDAGSVTDETWREIVDTLLTQELDPHEEHLLKLVHVCLAQWKNNKLSSKAGFYVDAAKSCLIHKMSFCTYEE
ncbi:uncharacterized protein LOC110447848 [Mizuhopecten yessoensis]|uniref:Uncharacterized protein n=1 Tax=Mizuhopecten yessoensis TaxID=6573 RepID=A0A210QUE4_MIZYE|nr:uncharacterized protein LOC110447848 [Mizuhopecten yessoensis]XP_021349471.1 uncharacterized protein LOC110447848 [Mizuhopecten yessoensis]OWF52361.1 hypothetical protein KP79_PYT18529 [Mizuhopecten yessoensis]